jgi:1-acyl-sn-glycerol-3-phosphate acyltransferase
MLLRISNFLKAIFIVLSLLMTTILGGIALLIFRSDLGVKGYFFFARWCSRTILKVCSIKVDVQGLENVKDLRGVIYTPNHMSHFDILVLMVSLPKYFSFVFKKELAKIPIFGWGLNKSGNILVDREKIGPSTIKSIKEEIKKRNSIVMFPGGTRSKTGYLNEKFKDGPFVMAQVLKVRIVPVTINGSFFIHNKVSPGIINSGRVEVIIHEPLNDFVEPIKLFRVARKTAISEMSSRVRKIILSKFKTEV